MVRIANSDQATTLELMKTHEEVKTEKHSSLNNARSRAVLLDADVAQVIFRETTNTSQSITIRFWRKK